MAIKTWNSTSGGSWDDPSNWTPGGAPDPSGADDVVFNPLGGGYTVTIGDMYFGDEVTTLVIDETLTISIGMNSLTVDKHTTFLAGTVTLAGGSFSLGSESSTVASGAEITGFGSIYNPFTGSGTIEATGGLLDVSDPIGAGNLQFKIATSGTLEMDCAVGAGNAFIFEGSGGGLALNDVSEFNGTVFGLVDGGSGTTPVNFIEIGGVTDITAVYNGGSIVLSGGVSATIHLGTSAYAPTTSAEVVTVDGNTEIFLYNSAVCFAEGTRILTDRGEIAVEALAEGDVAVTADGEALPVRWIGYRHIDLANHPRSEFAAPVRIRRGAFAESQPRRDLVVSPDHCLFVDGKLIPAKLLINGMTVVQERDTRAVTYYHVELDRHAVLLAEGLPAESYLDTGNRAFFSNAGLALMLHPEFHVNAGLNCWEQDACAPLAVSEIAVRPVWQALADRARQQGFERPEVVTTDEADLRLIAGGRTFRPTSAHANRFVFVLPAGITEAQLVSRADSPANVKPWLEDWRQLGVAVSRFVVRSGVEYTDIPVDHPSLRQGWHSVETERRAMWRWTDGNAFLPIEAGEGPVTVEVHVRQLGTYVVAKAETTRRLAA